MKQVRVQINGKTRVAKLEQSTGFRLMGFESRVSRERFRRAMKNTVAFRVEIGDEAKILILIPQILELAERGDKRYKDFIASAIADLFHD